MDSIETEEILTKGTASTEIAGTISIGIAETTSTGTAGTTSIETGEMVLTVTDVTGVSNEGTVTIGKDEMAALTEIVVTVLTGTGAMDLTGIDVTALTGIAEMGTIAETTDEETLIEGLQSVTVEEDFLRGCEVDVCIHN